MKRLTVTDFLWNNFKVKELQNVAAKVTFAGKMGQFDNAVEEVLKCSNTVKNNARYLFILANICAFSKFFGISFIQCDKNVKNDFIGHWYARKSLYSVHHRV